MRAELQAVSGAKAQWRPTFIGALRAMWLFTWKNQVAWPRLPMAVLGLFALPALICITTSTPRLWAEKHRVQPGNPVTYLNGFAKRLARLKVPLQAEQRTELTRIFTEEFARVERESVAVGDADANPEAQADLVDRQQERMLSRIQAVLDDRQFAEYQSYERRHRNAQLANRGDPAWGRTSPFYHCLIDLYFFIILPLSCVRACGAVIRDELEAGTLSFLTTRPLGRARLLILKYLAQTAWLELWLAVQTFLLLGAGWLREVPELQRLLPLLVGVQLLAVPAWSALGLLLGQISKRYLALALLYGLIVEMGLGRIPTNINNLSLIRHMQPWLSHNPALQAAFHWPAGEVATSASALVLATTIFLISAALLFTFKEYHSTTEMQK